MHASGSSDAGGRSLQNRRAGRLVLTALLALTATACGRQAVVQSGPAGGETVNVQLEEYMIQMPMAITEGEITFVTRNGGAERHGLALRGNNFHRSLADELGPGEGATSTLRLSPGTYEVYCPVADHEAIGMSRRITVTRGG